MKSSCIAIFIALTLLTGCGRTGQSIASLRSKWEKFKTIWGEDTEGMLASEGFYGPLDDEFVPLEEDDLQMQFADAVVPQPKEIPGEAGGPPSLDQFKRAMSDLAQIFQNVYFNTDDHVIRRPEHLVIIDKIAVYLKKHPHTYVAIGGHCDERASESYNLALGTRRANYVRSLLVQRGVNPNRVHSVSHGKEQPVDMGHNASAWARNRRVEFRIHSE